MAEVVWDAAWDAVGVDLAATDTGARPRLPEDASRLSVERFEQGADATGVGLSGLGSGEPQAFAEPWLDA